MSSVDFRQAFGGFEKGVELETAYSRERVERTGLGDGNDIIRLRD